jgi:thermitase
MVSNTRLASISLLLAAVSSLWAGKQFPAGPSDVIIPDQLIVRFKAGVNPVPVLARIAPQAVATLVSKHSNTHLLHIPAAQRENIASALAAAAETEYIEPNRVRTINVGSPNDPSYSSQWALATIHALQAWSYVPDQYLTSAVATSSRVKIAVLDTGADCTHPDFKNAGGTSTDSASGGQLSFTLSQAIVPTTVASATCPWQDDHYHGTHTAGTIAAATHNGAGVASIGYPVQLLIYKVLDNTGSGSDSGIATAIESATDAGAQVISMSLGGAGYSQSLQSAIDYAWEHNVVVVAAAGNTGSNALTYPGAANHAVGVAATDTVNARASFSTYGNWVKIAAPGVNILSTFPSYANPSGVLNYGTLSGTSMATPHVAGVAGLLAVANPGLSAAAIIQRLQQSAQLSGGGWNQYLGYGVLDAAAAVSGATGSAATGSLTGQVVDANALPIGSITLSANGQSFTTASDGLFRIANLPPGGYTLTATGGSLPAVSMQTSVVSGADSLLTVTMGVPTGEFTGSVTHNASAVAGVTVEAISGGVVQAAATTDANGRYALYVAPGTYDLTTSANGSINTTVAGRSVVAGAVTTVDLAISIRGSISGVVQDSSGAVVANAAVDVSGSFTAGATTNMNGSFTTVGLPSGTYAVKASAPGYTSTTLTGVVVSADTSTPVTLVFVLPVPVITGVAPSGVTNTTATITWTTNRAATSQAQYGTTSAYGSTTPLDSTLVTSHSVALSNLAPATTYHYQVSSRDARGLVGASGDLTFTTLASGGTQLLFQAHMDASEVSGTVNGSSVNPAVAPSGMAGRVVVNGAGSVNYAPAQSGNGAYFLNCCTNTNNAYYQFTGSGIGNSFNVAQGQVTFYIKSRYSFAQRQSSAASPRYSFDVRDASGHQFYFLTQIVSSRLQFSYAAGASAQYYYVPAGNEDTLFGGGVLLKVALAWNSTAGTMTLSLNDTPVKTTAYTKSAPNWTSASTFDLGAYEYLSYGGYDVLDDILDEFTVTGPAAKTDSTPPSVSMTAPAAGATVSGVVAVSANATDNVGVSSVQFKLDGANLGAPVTTGGPAYSLNWDTTGAPNGSHTLSAVAADAAGNTAAAGAVTVRVGNVSPPPVISAVSAGSVSSTGVTITWTTDKSADSQVVYGLAATYGSTSALNSTMVTSHSVPLSGLSASTTYHYQVLSRDAQGNLSSSADFTFTTAAPATGPQPLLLLHADASEVSGVSNGSVVTPAVAPAGFSGSVVVKGTGSVNYAPAQSGNGVYFLSCCSTNNTNTGYYKFTGSTIGSIFNAAQGQVTFYLKSRYSWAQRQAAGATTVRYAFDVRDANGHQFYFLSQVLSGRLEFSYSAGGNAQYYYVQAGSEDALFGSGVILKITLAWDSTAGTMSLSLNDAGVRTTAYAKPALNWTSASTFDLGAYEYLSYGGYYVMDDIVDEFTVR